MSQTRECTVNRKNKVEMKRWDLIFLGHAVQADLLPYFMKSLEGFDKLSIIEVSMETHRECKVLS